jgi:hypothetical protein
MEGTCTVVTALELRRVLQTLVAFEPNIALLVLEMWQSSVTQVAVSPDLQARILQSLTEHGVRMEAAVGDTHQILLSTDYVPNGGRLVLVSLSGLYNKPDICFVPMWVRDLDKDIPTATVLYKHVLFRDKEVDLTEAQLGLVRTGRPLGQRCIAIAPCHGSSNSLLQVGCNDVHCGKACGDVALVMCGSTQSFTSVKMLNLYNLSQLPAQVTPGFLWGERIIRMAGKEHAGLATFKVQNPERYSEDLLAALTAALLPSWDDHVPESDRKLEKLLRSRVGSAHRQPRSQDRRTRINKSPQHFW